MSDSMSEAVDSIESTLEWLRKRFQPEPAAGLSAVYQVELSGEGGGLFWARVDDGRLSSGEGRSRGPDVVIKASAQDFYGFLSGRENPDLLYMEGRIAIEGSITLALRLRLIFSAPSGR